MVSNSQIQIGEREGRNEDLYMLSAGRGKELTFSPYIGNLETGWVDCKSDYVLRWVVKPLVHLQALYQSQVRSGIGLH